MVAIETIIKILQQETARSVQPGLDRLVMDIGKDPFMILISCLLSLRTKDTVSLAVSKKLFAHATTPYEMLEIPRQELEKMLHEIGFFRKKAAIIHAVSSELIKNFGGHVPRTQQELLSIPGVGRKTANAVLGHAFNIPAICVDTHVHRIANRLGLVRTKTPKETEYALMEKIPMHYWIDINRLLVIWGQTVCTPLSPKCSSCALQGICEQRGVIKHR